MQQCKSLYSTAISVCVFMGVFFVYAERSLSQGKTREEVLIARGVQEVVNSGFPVPETAYRTKTKIVDIKFDETGAVFKGVKVRFQGLEKMFTNCRIEGKAESPAQNVLDTQLLVGKMMFECDSASFTGELIATFQSGNKFSRDFLDIPQQEVKPFDMFITDLRIQKDVDPELIRVLTGVPLRMHVTEGRVLSVDPAFGSARVRFNFTVMAKE